MVRETEGMRCWGTGGPAGSGTSLLLQILERSSSRKRFRLGIELGKNHGALFGSCGNFLRGFMPMRYPHPLLGSQISSE